MTVAIIHSLAKTETSQTSLKPLDSWKTEEKISSNTPSNSSATSRCSPTKKRITLETQCQLFITHNGNLLVIMSLKITLGSVMVETKAIRMHTMHLEEKPQLFLLRGSSMCYQETTRATQFCSIQTTRNR